MRKTCTSVSLMFMVGCLFLAPVANAEFWNFQKPADWYGQLNQNLVPDWGDVACAPTAAVNSFDYLQFHYPGHYGTLLVPDSDGDGNVHNDPDDLINVVQTLGQPAYMDTIANNGTYWWDFVWGKYDYLELVAPGRTVYEAQDAFDWAGSGEVRPVWDVPTNPTPEFIYGQLSDCEDVELFLMTESGGHAVTLSSWQWDTVAQSGLMDYIDPWTGAMGVSSIWMDAGRLETDYFGGTSSWIQGAVSESVPEPITLVMLGCVGAGMLAARKLRGKRAA